MGKPIDWNSHKRREKLGEDRSAELESDSVIGVAARAATNSLEQREVEELLRRTDVLSKVQIQKWTATLEWLRAHPSRTLTASWRSTLDRTQQYVQMRDAGCTERPIEESKIKYKRTAKMEKKLADWMTDSSKLPKAPPGRR